MHTVVVYLIRVVEVMFVIGAAGCALSVIPITAYRLFMVLFEPNIPGEEEDHAQVPTSRESFGSPSVSSVRQAS